MRKYEELTKTIKAGKEFLTTDDPNTYIKMEVTFTPTTVSNDVKSPVTELKVKSSLTHISQDKRKIGVPEFFKTDDPNIVLVRYTAQQEIHLPILKRNLEKDKFIVNNSSEDEHEHKRALVDVSNYEDIIRKVTE
jgi:hypothetical protein